MPNKAPLKVSEFYVPNQPVGAQNYLQAFTATFSPTATIGKAVPKSFAATLFPGGGGGGGPVLDDSYDVSNFTFGVATVDTINTTDAGQTFTSTGGVLLKATFYLISSGSPTGNVYAKLYATASGVPTGSALATSDPVNVTTLTGSYTLTDFAFSGGNQYNMVAGTKYLIAVEFLGGTTGSDNITLGGDTTSPTHPGTFYTLLVGSWGSHFSDLIFYVYIGGSVGANLATLSRRIGKALGGILFPSSANTFTGLTAYYKLDEASGTRNDSIGSNNLTDHASVGSASGKVGNAATFVNASSQYLSCADAAAFQMGTGNFSVACWMKKSVAALSGVLVDYGTINLGGAGYYLIYSQADHTCQAGIRGSGITGIALAVTHIDDGNWHLVIATFDRGSNLSLYIDNLLEKTASLASVTGSVNNSSGLNIGAEQGATFFDGSIDEVGIWNRILTPMEMTALWNGGAGTTYGNSTVIPAGSLIKTFIAAGGTLFTQSLAATLSFVGSFSKGWHHFQSFTATLFPSAGGGGGTPDIINENFEGTGTPTGWGVYQCTCDYTAAPLSGTQSLLVPDPTQGTTAYFFYNGAAISSTTRPEVFGKVLFRPDFDASTTILRMYDVTQSFVVMEFSYIIGGSLEITQGGSTAPSTVDVMTIGTIYDVYFHYKEGSGSNGICEIAFVVTGGAKPTVGSNAYAGFTNGTSTADLGLFLGGPYPSTGCGFTLDNFQLASTDIFSGGGGWATLVETFIAGGHAFTQALSATLSSTAALTRRTAHGLTAATLSFVGAMTRRTSHSLAATLSFVSAITKRSTRFLTATLSFVGAMTTLAVHHFTQAFTATLSFIGSFSEKNIITRAFTATLSFVGASSRSTLKALSATLSWSASFARKLSRSLTATLSFVAATTKQATRSLSATLSWIGNLAEFYIHGGTQFTQSLAATLSFIGTFAEKNIITRAFTATLNATAAFSKSTSKALSATLGWSASLVRRITRSLSGTLSFTGTLVKAIRDAGFTATLSFVGNLVGQAAHFFARAFTATLSSTAALATHRTVVRVLAATLAFSAALRGRTAKVFAATLTVSGQFRKVLRKVFSATTTFIGFLFRGGAITVLAGWITKCLASIGISGSSPKIANTGSQLKIQKSDAIPLTGSTLSVQRRK